MVLGLSHLRIWEKGTLDRSHACRLGVTAPRRVLEFGVTIMIRLSRGSQKSFNFPPPKFGLLRVSTRLCCVEGRQHAKHCVVIPAIFRFSREGPACLQTSKAGASALLDARKPVQTAGFLQKA